MRKFSEILVVVCVVLAACFAVAWFVVAVANPLVDYLFTLYRDGKYGAAFGLTAILFLLTAIVLAEIIGDYKKVPPAPPSSRPLL